MTDIRTRIVLNKGRVGIPLNKLADVARETERFLESIGVDCKLPESRGKWLALNFENGSLAFDIAYHGTATEEQVIVCKKHLRTAITSAAENRRPEQGISIKTYSHLANLSTYLDVGENITFGLYENGEPSPQKWQEISQQSLSALHNVLANEFESHGAIQGYIHSIVRDKVSPYVEIRDSDTRLLIKCYYKPEHYEAIVSALKPADALVYVSGDITMVRSPSESMESIDISEFRKLEAIKPGTLDRFFGCMPRMTGRLASETAIAKVRHG